ncbi:MAG: hypothetical protein JNL98_41460 [Bryobacterales bacterium]|nr:hypothetical protein [Bryobacterales bacterium]
MIAIFTVRARQIREGQPVHVPVCEESGLREYNVYAASCTASDFLDVPSTLWYFPFVQTALHIVSPSLKTEYCAPGWFCPEIALSPSYEAAVMHRGDMSTYVVYGIWNQTPIHPDYSGGSGYQLPATSFCSGTTNATRNRVFGVYYWGPDRWTAEAIAVTTGPEASRWSQWVSNFRFTFNGNLLHPAPLMGETTSATRASVVRYPPTGQYYDPPGAGTLRMQATHNFKNSCNQLVLLC